jgi:hypothetical protein
VHDRFDESLRVALPDCFDDVGVAGGEGHAYARLREIDYGQPNDNAAVVIISK